MGRSGAGECARRRQVDGRFQGLGKQRCELGGRLRGRPPGGPREARAGDRIGEEKRVMAVCLCVCVCLRMCVCVRETSSRSTRVVLLGPLPARTRARRRHRGVRAPRAPSPSPPPSPKVAVRPRPNPLRPNTFRSDTKLDPSLTSVNAARSSFHPRPHARARAKKSSFLSAPPSPSPQTPRRSSLPRRRRPRMATSLLTRRRLA